MKRWESSPLRKLLATIASLNEILINYSAGNRAGMSNCPIRDRGRGKVKIQKKREREREIYRRFWLALLPACVSRRGFRREGRGETFDRSMVLRAVGVLC